MKSRKFKPLSDGFLGKVEPNVSTHAVDPTTLPGHSPVTPSEIVFFHVDRPCLYAALKSDATTSLQRASSAGHHQLIR